MKRIGLTQRVETVESYDETRDCLDQRWAELLYANDFVPVPLSNCVEEPERYLAELDLDGIVFTGGNDFADLPDATDVAPERDRFERAALERAIETKLPVLGVCRGLQLLHRYFGGALEPVEGHVAETHTVDVEGSSLIDDRTSVETNSYHGYGFRAETVPDELTVCGRTEDGLVEWLVHDTLPVEGVMWHPERPDAPGSLDRRIITNRFGSGQ